ncbi:putative Two component sensor histidine kinase AdeS [uncultured Alphaproteobacteria bacterium]|uniref:histidine kinase n=1 Tax=uncultured Alphaproteobacteria bacterium TaxID=91750 RepID=A0A212JMA8_9PROT|nr:putative Two component sensor histidine kinase AdeS [uncultured Alphaproteobacteria bacterium]
MRGAGNLSRKITRFMVLLALLTTLLSLLGTYAFYAVWFALFPNVEAGDGGDWFPTPLEWGWMALVIGVALSAAILFALKLSKTIITPLNAVAESLRQVAQGNLSIRADIDGHPPDEATQLVRDFNTMAERLERVERERQFWNAAIAHELRTPVTVLRGRLQGLTDGVFEPDPAMFRSLLTQIEGLGRLIEDLRLVGLAESGRLELRRELTDLATAASEVVQVFEPSLREAGFTVSCPADGPAVVCDPVRIRQALLALLENALCHADPGPLRIGVQITEGFCHLLIEDSGPGVSMPLAAQIFEPFQRGNPHGRSGSGLGLAVVQAIARAHGGEVTCRPSTLGGTVFDLHWPI